MFTAVFTAADDALVTVVVVTYRGARFLDRCLDSVAEQDLARQGRVACWVVDNASEDGTADVLRARRDGVRVLRAPRNLGFAGGNNLALREVTTRYAVLLNDDAVAGPGWLAGLLEPFDDPRVGAVAGKLLLRPRFLRVGVRVRGAARLGVDAVHRDGHDVTGAVPWDPLLAGPQPGPTRWCAPEVDLLVPLAGDEPRLPQPLRLVLDLRAEQPGVVEVEGREHPLGPWGERVAVDVPPGVATVDVLNSAGTVLHPDGSAGDRGFGRVDDGSYDAPLEVFGGCGASLALRTAALRDVGLFDDDWFLYYEDVDLCWRLRRRGWVVHYAPASVARHEHSASAGTRSDLHVFHDQRNRLLTLAKNASLPLVARTVGRFPLTTAAGVVRALRPAGPGAHLTVLRLRVLGSALRLLPRVLARRRRVQRTAVVPRRAVEAWLGWHVGTPR
ncbi:MAG: glycosyltransferase [Actinomycetota bacterium]|nr:glycosyltransferase [Actinomycetota bacterium]